MTDQELRDMFFDFAEEYGELAIEIFFQKYIKIHRKNLEHILRSEKEHLDRIKYPKEVKK